LSSRGLRLNSVSLLRGCSLEKLSRGEGSGKRSSSRNCIMHEKRRGFRKRNTKKSGICRKEHPMSKERQGRITCGFKKRRVENNKKKKSGERSQIVP